MHLPYGTYNHPLLLYSTPLYVTCSTIIRFLDSPCILPVLPSSSSLSCSSISSSSSITRRVGDNKKQMDRKYKIVKKIGQGTFGKVYEAEHDIFQRVAIKRIEKTSNVSSREVDILQMIDHEHCIKLIDVFYTSEDGSTNKKFQNLVLEYHPQTLFRFIQDRSCTPQLTKALFYQLCLAIQYIHRKQICHRDITPNNVLISSKGRMILADFGSAKLLETGHISMSYVCSRYYRAPELLLGCPNYSLKVDIWSAGCVLAEMLMGRPIFPGINNSDQFMKIILVLGAPSSADLTAMRNVKYDIKFPSIDPLYFGKLLPNMKDADIVADLLYGMLCYNPKSRLSIDQVLEHPYFGR